MAPIEDIQACIIHDLRRERDALRAAFDRAAETYPTAYPMTTPAVQEWWAAIYRAVLAAGSPGRKV